MAINHSFESLVQMKPDQVAEVFRMGHPVDPASIAGFQYLGVDLCLPPWVNRILWKTFRKTFYRDPETGIIRGWNVRLEQRGWESVQVPLLKSGGEEFSFGHYHLCSAEGKKFPKGWKGSHYLDYGLAGNPFFDPAGLGYCPLVAVNEGSSDLLLGWEVFKVGNVFIPLNDYWLLKKEGPLEKVVAVPTKR